MKRPYVIVVVLVILVGVLAAGGSYLARKHQREVVEQAERDRLASERAAAAESYRRLSAIQSRASAALDRLNTLQNAYSELYHEAVSASNKRHDLVGSNPYDVAGALAYVRSEKQGVEALQPITGQKADAARNAASAFAEAYGESATAALLTDISVAAEAESAGLSDWWHAANNITDAYTASANGRYYARNDDNGGLYKSSDDEGARSKQRWDTVGSRFESLRNRLDHDVANANAKSGATGAPSFFGAAAPAVATFAPPPVAVSATVGTESDARRFVGEFYAAINQHRLADAYDMLSADFKATTSRSKFTAGYRTTVGVVASTSTSDDPALIFVNLTAKDRKPGSSAIVTTRYVGTCRVVWDDQRRRWLLDDAHFSKM